MFETECERILRELEVYLDAELADEEECRRIERHLANCEQCFSRQNFVHSLRAIIRKKCGTAELPPGLAERIRGEIASAARD